MLRHTLIPMLIAIALNFGSNNSSAAHEGPDHTGHASQLWYLTDGTILQGSFIKATESELKILIGGETVRKIPMEQLSPRSQAWIIDRQAEIDHLNSATGVVRHVAFLRANHGIDENEMARPAIAESFRAFENSVDLRWDQKFLFVESNGIPDHTMMVGIRSWQQQVPLPQAYRGSNAWQIPLRPVAAKQPQTAKGKFLRGAIALAVNGIPIFNPLNNRGDDAYLFGELDEYGGHCGRADDYHYHIAPVHLEKIVGKGKPIAYALDGYPIMGYQDPNASDFAPLDWLNGHRDAHGNYHYHATEKYPYINGGFYGQVVERDGQVDPQPRAEPIRSALPPIRGARITKFEYSNQASNLTYEIQNRPGTVRYIQQENGSVDFFFTDPLGKSRKETYQRQRQYQESDKTPRVPESRNDRQRPQMLSASRDDSLSKNEVESRNKEKLLKLASTSVSQQGFLDVDCTCDGKKQSPAITWSELPEGTKSVAVSLWHTAPDQEKSYWVVYNIAPTVKGFEQGQTGIETVGINDKKRTEYDPMCSKGSGIKTYHFTVYAFAVKLDVKPQQMDRKRLLEEYKQYGLAESTFEFKYERR